MSASQTIIEISTIYMKILFLIPEFAVKKVQALLLEQSSAISWCVLNINMMNQGIAISSNIASRSDFVHVEMKQNYPSGDRFFRLGKLVRAKTVRCVRWTNLQTVTYRLHARARCIRMHHQTPNTKPIRCCSKVLEHCDEFLPGDTPEYFFDKNPENFTSILNIYRTGNK